MHRRVNLTEFRSEVEIVRSVVDGITTEHHECLDFPRRHIRAEFAKRFEMIDWIQLHRFGVINGGAHVAKGRVYGVRQSVHLSWLLLATYDQRRTMMLPQLASHSVEQLFSLGGNLCRTTQSQFCGECASRSEERRVGKECSSRWS